MTVTITDDCKLSMNTWHGQLRVLCDRYKLPYDRARKPNTAAIVRRLPYMKPEARAYMIRLVQESEYTHSRKKKGTSQMPTMQRGPEIERRAV